MSTIHAANYGDGVNSIAASDLIDGLSKGWGSIDGDATTVVYFGSYNASSVTDNALGNYTVSYTNNMNSAEGYAIILGASDGPIYDPDYWFESQGASSFIWHGRRRAASTLADFFIASYALHGDLA